MEKNEKNNKNNNSQLFFFPPVVAVLGHVDHGKTSLLDTIRKTSVVQREHGGITQKIGASSIEVIHENKKRKITFIDTPGHEAFSKMRSRGSQAADIGLLIISSVDGIMPQTRESIKMLTDAKIPFIVVLTKSDLPEKMPEKVKGQLLKEGIMLEGMGGDVPIIEVSAKTGTGIKELLELIIIVFDFNKPQEEEKETKFKGIVIESKLDQKAGPKATIVIKKGQISVKEELTSEGITAKVRTLIDDKGKHLEKAGQGEAVEVLGFEKVPTVGSIVYKKGEAYEEEKKEIEVSKNLPPEENMLPVVLCADTLGSLEAINGMLPQGIFVVSQKTGDVTESDILLAKSTSAIVIGFNTKIRPDALKLTRTEKVLFKNYAIIYELLDELKDVVEGRKQALIEEVYGTAKILASFPFEKTKVLGIIVLDGRVARGDKVRLMRGETEIGEANVISLRQGKNLTSKVEKGKEAGIIISPSLDFTIGDMLIFHG